MERRSRIGAQLAQRYLIALQFRDYRWIWLGAMSAHSAYWALIVARGVLVLEMSKSSLMVGLVTFAAMAPRFIVPPLAGYLADRFDRRTVLRSAYALNMTNNVVLTVLAFSGVLEVWHVIALSVVNGSLRTFEMTGMASLVPNLVPRQYLMNAIAFNQATMQGSRLVGPALMVPALVFFGADAAFLVSTLFYVSAVMAVGRIRTRSSGGVQKGAGIAASMMEALSYVWRDHMLRAVFILTALHCAFTMSFESLLPVFSRDVLDAGGAGVGYLMMAVGAGGLVSVVLLSGVRNEQASGRLLIVMGTLSGLSMIGLGASTLPLPAVLAAVAMGASQAAYMAIASVLIQQTVPDALRGRTSALFQINIGGNMALVNLSNGLLADYIGSVAVLMALGSIFPVMMAASLAVPTLRRIYTGALTPPAEVAPTA